MVIKKSGSDFVCCFCNLTVDFQTTRIEWVQASPTVTALAVTSQPSYLDSKRKQKYLGSILFF